MFFVSQSCAQNIHVIVTLTTKGHPLQDELSILLGIPVQITAFVLLGYRAVVKQIYKF
jgi:hypothetical protein